MLLVLTAICTVPMARTQTPVSVDCDATRVQASAPADFPSEWQARHPNAVYLRYGSERDENRWLDVFTDLRAMVADHPDIPPAEKAKALGQFDALLAEIRRVESSDDRAMLLETARGVGTTRFRMESFVPVDADEMVYTLFPDTPDAIEVGEATAPEARRALCWMAIATDRLLVRYGQTPRDVAVRALDAMVAQWDAFNQSSYSMYPWELWANSLGARRERLIPPRHQIVLLHPSIGLGVTGQDFENLARQDVIAFEPVGYLVYNRARTWYGGASALLTLPREGGPGVGGMLHFSPTIRAGYVFRVADSGTPGGVVVSLDLYKTLTGVPARLHALRTRVVEITLDDESP